MQGRRIDRYILGPEIAVGGMASVHLARMLGKGGFGKTVAMKRLHAQYGRAPEFVTLFQDEARVTSGLTHPNVVMTLDVLEDDDELYLVMEYVHGAALSQILRPRQGQAPPPLRIAVGIVAAMLDGLHAAHEATDENGVPLDIIHRDVSPQNVLVTFQGVAKIADFGIAKAAGRVHSTDDGSLKGKAGYMAPEQLLGLEVTTRTDLYASGIVLWETLTGKRLIDFKSMAENLRAVLELEVEPPSSLRAEVPDTLDQVVMRAVQRDPSERFSSAKEMALALRKASDAAHAAEIGDWLCAERHELLEMRELALSELQRAMGSAGDIPAGFESAPSLRVSVPHIPTGPTMPSRKDDAPAPRDPSSDPAYLAAAAQPPPPTRRFFPVLTVAFVVGVAGLLIFLLTWTPSSLGPSGTVREEREAVSSSSPAVSASSSASSASSAWGEESPPTPRPSVAIDPPASAERPNRPAPSSTSSTAKPRPMASASASASRKCRIVPSMDSTGHTKFTEVCP
ncbi:Serine/threonine protein kinase [Labilithrix luteola]|uniref:Serine/threonine protein kinase n=1 Tax=Labilithrix luteola TaxID=1391654 RepID=A0A0K1PRM1_9BACT|nr:serine/threonine-protein kinase [Labilithrix luteola]AKU96195.1 Serine/threonine protein kinase [Labilithrix luteola]